MLDATQLQTLADHIAANTDPVVIAALSSGSNNKILKWYNAEADPVFWVFVNSVSVDEVRRSIDWDEVLDAATGLTAIQQFGFNVLFHNDTYDPQIEANRDALVKIFPSGMTNTRAAVLADATRHATEAEKIFAQTATGPGGGNGSAQNASAIAVVYGAISGDDISGAIALIP